MPLRRTTWVAESDESSDQGQVRSVLTAHHLATAVAVVAVVVVLVVVVPHAVAVPHGSSYIGEAGTVE